MDTVHIDRATGIVERLTEFVRKEWRVPISDVFGVISLATENRARGEDWCVINLQHGNWPDAPGTKFKIAWNQDRLEYEMRDFYQSFCVELASLNRELLKLGRSEGTMQGVAQ